MSAWPLQADVAVQDARHNITFVSSVLLRQCDVNFVACIFLPDGSAHECQMCEITFGGKVSNLLKNTTFYKKINANVNIKNVCFEWRILKEDVKMKN